MVLVAWGAGREVGEGCDGEGEEEGVDEGVGWKRRHGRLAGVVGVVVVVGRGRGQRRTQGHALDFGVGEGDAQVVEGEHAVEGLDEELDL